MTIINIKLIMDCVSPVPFVLVVVLFLTSVHLPSQTDVSVPGFRMKSEKSGGQWRLQIDLVYCVIVPVTTKQLQHR